MAAIEVPRSAQRVLLVIIGALGDWCVRRVLQHAEDYAKERDVADVVLVDVHGRNQVRNCIARRLIEQTAQTLDSPTTLRSGGEEHGAVHYPLLRGRTRSHSPPRALSRLAAGIALPDPTHEPGRGGKGAAQSAIEDFCENFVAHPSMEGVKAKLRATPKVARGAYEELRQKADDERLKLKHTFQALSTWALGKLKVRIGRRQPLDRYWKSTPGDVPSFETRVGPRAFPVTHAQIETLAKHYRIIVYVATPPQAYPEIIRRWAPYASRIALEKPIAGLLIPDGNRLKLIGEPTDIQDLVDAKTHATALSRAKLGLPPLEVVTIDHYNSKWVVYAIDVAKRRHIVDHILAYPQLILVQVCETEILPNGRFWFYNGVGGALADMIAHLMQPLRAVTGYPSAAEMLDNVRVRKVQRARYRTRLVRASRPPRFLGDYRSRDAEKYLIDDTETFGEIQMQFISGHRTGVDVIVRTGKGVLPQSKILRVYGPDDGEGAATVTFDIGKSLVHLGLVKRDTSQCVWLERWMRTDPFGIEVDERPVTTDAEEYAVLFEGLCGWPPPDPRYFPPVSEAARVYEFFRRALVRERFEGHMEETYKPYSHYPFYNSCELSYEDVNEWEKALKNLGVRV